jgi:hypothetical protein
LLEIFKLALSAVSANGETLHRDFGEFGDDPPTCDNGLYFIYGRTQGAFGSRHRGIALPEGRYIGLIVTIV